MKTPLFAFLHWSAPTNFWISGLLRHRQIKNTMRYIGKIQFKSADFETTSASTVEDVLRLGKEGWIEYSSVKINSI